MNTNNLPSHIAAAITAETAKHGTPTPMVPFGDAIRFQYPDGAVSYITYNEKRMQWEHKTLA